jgi:seryl-tRNA synthetase
VWWAQANFEAGSRVAGNNFVFFRNEAALMELALVQWVMGKAAARGFTPVLTPDVVRPVTAEGCGFQPRGTGTQVSPAIAAINALAHTHAAHDTHDTQRTRS